MKCYSRGGTVVHRRRLLGIRSIEAFLAAPYPPPAHPISLQAYPHVTRLKVETYGQRDPL